MDSSSDDEVGFIYDKKGYVNVWVDGSCLRNGQPGAKAGYGFFYDWNHHLNVAAPVTGRATNNVGEIQAAIRAIKDCGVEDIDRLCIKTDSRFLVDSVNKWLNRWRRNGFCKANGEPLANKDDFKELSDVLNKNKHMMIKFEHVPGHCGEPRNEEADRLAREGAELYGKW